MKLIRFGIHVTEPERAIRFYRTVFGWEFERLGGQLLPYWALKNPPPGLRGGVLNRAIMGNDVNGFLCTFEVDALQTVVQRVEAAGGKIAERQAIPSTGMLVICRDADGNLFGLQEADRAVRELNPLLQKGTAVRY